MLIAIPLARTSAQSMDDLNLQVHGYITQGFVYSSHDNWNTTNSTDGSASLTEAVVGITVQPQPKLRVTIQARYSLLGNFGNEIELDLASADVKLNERFGFRVGKVRSPIGMLDETMGIDPAQLWVLLPQAIYPLSSRDSILAHYGGTAYGNVALGETLGTLEYRAYGGERVISADDGVFQPYRDMGFSTPTGSTGPTYGGTLRWHAPVHGLLIGMAENSEQDSGVASLGAYRGTFTTGHFTTFYYFGSYEHRKWMFAGEYNRLGLHPSVALAGLPGQNLSSDLRAWYAMTSYKLSSKLTGGLYYASSIDRKAPFNSDRYQKDWAISARYDFNPYLYIKLEQHVMDGTLIGFSRFNNSDLEPNTRMTLLKLGVSF